jgi:site-specific recombinase XerD
MSLFNYSKEYLYEKTLETNRKSNKIENIEPISNKILESTTVDKLKDSVKNLVNNGLGSLARLNNAVYQFNIYSNANLNSLDDIDVNYLIGFREWLTVGSSKQGYVNAVIELVKSIQNKTKIKIINDNEFKLVRIVTPSKRKNVVDVMDSEEYEFFVRNITKYKYRTELEKARNILMTRIILFSGITVKELCGLELGESFIVDSKSICINLENRKRIIDIPRDKIIAHFNKYKELMLTNENIDISNGKLFLLSQGQIDRIIKELLEFSKIDRKPNTALMLRYSYFVYLWNHRTIENKITFKTIHDISGIANKKELQHILNVFDDGFVSLSSAFVNL